MRLFRQAATDFPLFLCNAISRVAASVITPLLQKNAAQRRHLNHSSSFLQSAAPARYIVLYRAHTDVYEYSGKYSNLDALSRFIEYLKFYDEATDYMEVEGMIQDLHEIWYDFDIETLTEEDAGVYVDRVIQMAEANGAEIQIW